MRIPMYKNIFFLTGIISPCAGAYLVNGEMLLNDMHKRSAVAAGYIEGVTDSLNHSHFCIPAGTGTSQLKAVVRDYLDKNTALIAKPAANLTSMALKQSYPCVE